MSKHTENRLVHHLDTYENGVKLAECKMQVLAMHKEVTSNLILICTDKVGYIQLDAQSFEKEFKKMDAIEFKHTYDL